MFGQVPETPYDLRFTLLGVPIRVHPVFWLTSAVLSWNWAQDARGLRFDVLFVCVLCIFVAILVHEMGHALVTRRFGWRPEVVLYFFGGYATSMRHTTWRDIAVSAAGPGMGLLLLFVIWWAAKLSGLVTPDSTMFAPTFILDGTRQRELIADAVNFSLFINLAWNLVNLLPVLPLDGGQISRELLCWLNPHKGMEQSLLLSTLASGGVALWSLNAHMNGRGVLGLDPLFLGIMFGFLSYLSFQQYDASRRGY